MTVSDTIVSVGRISLKYIPNASLLLGLLHRLLGYSMETNFYSSAIFSFIGDNLK
jgi:hypothetical protein